MRCQAARAPADAGRPLTSLDYKFHFFPWWRDQTYSLPGAMVLIGEDHERYFDQLHANGIELSTGQKAWYVNKKELTNAADVRREYPSTPDEAFEQALEGAIFSREIALANSGVALAPTPLIRATSSTRFGILGATTTTFSGYISSSMGCTASSAITRTRASTSATM